MGFVCFDMDCHKLLSCMVILEEFRILFCFVEEFRILFCFVGEFRIPFWFLEEFRIFVI